MAPPPHGLQPWEIGVTVVMATLMLGLVCVLLPYCLWRRRWLPVRGLVWYLQDYEDGGE